MKDIVKDLEALWRMERSRDRLIKEGDRNTTYFQAVANQKHRKRRISGLEGPEGWIEDDQLMLEHAVNFYKNLFGQEDSSEVELVWIFGRTVSWLPLLRMSYSRLISQRRKGGKLFLDPMLRVLLTQMDFLSFSIRCSRMLLKRLNESDPHV